MRLIDGNDRPKGARHLAKWQCRTCEADTGVASTITQLVNLGGFIHMGKLKPGHRVRVCSMCLARGKITQAD